jgi:hypothetical protein
MARLGGLGVVMAVVFVAAGCRGKASGGTASEGTAESARKAAPAALTATSSPDGGPELADEIPESEQLAALEPDTAQLDAVLQVVDSLEQKGQKQRVSYLGENDFDRLPEDNLICWEENETLFCKLPGQPSAKRVGPIIDSGSGGCYAACGSGCAGGCQHIPVGYDGSENAVPCLAWRSGIRRQHAQFQPVRRPDGAWGGVVPAKHLEADPARACAAVGDRPKLQPTGRYLIACTVADCCRKHDECTRMDKGFDRVRCHLKGIKQCGGGALIGRPTAEISLIWFNDQEWAVSHAGQCTGSASSWLEPKPTRFTEDEVKACLVHGGHGHPRAPGTYPPGISPATAQPGALLPAFPVLPDF